MNTAPEGLHMSAERAETALQATYQVEGMLKALHGAAIDPGDALPYLVRGMTVRLNELNNIVMTAIRGDECEDVELESMLVGEFAKP